jgi:hypothetical protein
LSSRCCCENTTMNAWQIPWLWYNGVLLIERHPMTPTHPPCPYCSKWHHPVSPCKSNNR